MNETELQNMYDKYIETRGKDYWTNVENELENILGKWKDYETKIKKDSLTLKEYTNLKENSEYLCYFLEWGSEIFGGATPGNSKNYGVARANAKSKEVAYHLNGSNETIDGKKAQTYFKDIKSLLKEIVNAKDIESLNKLEAKNKNAEKEGRFSAKQILRKMTVLNNSKENSINLLHIYSDDAIDFLYKEFIPNKKEKSFFKRSNELTEYMLNHIKLEDNKKLIKIKKISSFLWDYLKKKDLTSEESPNVILYGPPGTGKTYTVTKMVNLLTQGNPERQQHVQFHPSYSYEDFIDGLKPCGVKNGSIHFDFVNGVFKDFCIKAKKDPEHTYYFIVDEINRANLSTVFGETLSLLEADYRDRTDDANETKLGKKIVTQNSKILESLIKEDPTNKEKAYYYDENEGVKFGIPKNIRFIGMMNDTDKSIDSFDLALRRRFKWKKMSCEYDVIAETLNLETSNEYIKSCKALNKYIHKNLKLGSSYEFGHAFFMRLKDNKVTPDNKKALFEEHLEPTLREYLRMFFEENEIEEKIEGAKKAFGIENGKKEN